MTETGAPKLGIPDLRRARAAGERLVMVTAYDYPSARMAEEAGVDLILVGDSAAMVVLGHDSTTAASMEHMLMFTEAVSRGSSRALVVGDMPFMSYQVSNEQAMENAGRFIAEAKADAVKLEGGGRMVERVRAVSEAGIAVFGHLGLTPQSATRLGGYRAQARSHEQALALVDDALALEAAGAVCIVLEAIPAAVATAVNARLTVPTIGIGAGGDVDGQVLVWHDLLGITQGRMPRFVERYADAAATIVEGLRGYTAAVRGREFPAERHAYTIEPAELAAFEAGLAARDRQRDPR